MHKSLHQSLSSVVVLYFKAQSYHWNVVGSDFAQLHSFFGDFYTEVYESIDPLAEQIRAIGESAPISLAEILKTSSVIEDKTIPAAHQMISNLKAANKIVINDLDEALKEAGDNQGLVNFLADRLDKHSKHDWMLNSFLKESTEIDEGVMDAAKRVGAIAGTLAILHHTLPSDQPEKVKHPVSGREYVVTPSEKKPPFKLKKDKAFEVNGRRYIPYLGNLAYKQPTDK